MKWVGTPQWRVRGMLKVRRWDRRERVVWTWKWTVSLNSHWFVSHWHKLRLDACSISNNPAIYNKTAFTIDFTWLYLTFCFSFSAEELQIWQRRSTGVNQKGSWPISGVCQAQCGLDEKELQIHIRVAGREGLQSSFLIWDMILWLLTRTPSQIYNSHSSLSTNVHLCKQTCIHIHVNVYKQSCAFMNVYA